jgi:hypothetical protein
MSQEQDVSKLAFNKAAIGTVEGEKLAPGTGFLRQCCRSSHYPLKRLFFSFNLLLAPALC